MIEKQQNEKEDKLTRARKYEQEKQNRRTQKIARLFM